MGKAADLRHSERREARLRELAQAESRGAGIATAIPARPRAGFESVDSSKKRRAAVLISTKSEDKELKQSDRRILLSSTRDLQRNMAIAAWAIRKHLDYISRFSFQSRTGDAEFDKDLEAAIAIWSKPRNCDAAGRHSLARLVRILEQCALVDGDAGLYRLASGRVQIVEGDRICEAEGLDKKPDLFSQGVEYTATGAAVRYCLAKRTDSGLKFDTWAPAEWLTLRGYYHRADQLRGVTPLSAGLNSMRDLHENFELALVKAKLHNVFGLAIVRAAVDGVDDGMPHVDAATGEEADADTERYSVNLTGGPFKLELDQGDDIKMLESQIPSNEFRNFAEMMIRSALLCCDIPYTFFDVKGSTYSGARQDLLQYYRSAESKREGLQEILDQVTEWLLARWVARGALVLPGKARIADINWEWIGAGQPWIDPVKEVTANRLAVEAGFTSTPRVCREHGVDAYEIAEEEGKYTAFRRDKGLPDVGAAPALPPEPPPDPEEDPAQNPAEEPALAI